MNSDAFGKIQRAAERLRHPGRLVNWLRARSERRRRPDSLHSFPIGIDLEPTTRCNLRCRACQRSEGYGAGEDLTVGRVERILDQLPQLEQIKLQGIGEPLLHEQFFDLVRRARRRHIRVSSITNGTTLDVASHRQGILVSGLDELLVSIDGATPATHARWRGGSDLDQIVFGLRRLVDLRGRARAPRLGIWCVGNPDNLAELRALVELAAAVGVDKLIYQTEMTSWGKIEWRDRLTPVRLDPQSIEAARQIEEARVQARRLRFPLTIYTGNRFSADRPCFWPWESCFISAGGYVTRCCVASDPGLHHFGRIDEMDFSAIWNSSDYLDLRRAIRENHIPSLCRDCYGMIER
jgi:pyrroloquinoline quinone biosynthesis protein E